MSEHSSYMDLVWKFLNFAVLIGILFKVGAKPFKAMLVKRSQTVRDKLEESEKAAKEAQLLKAEYEAKLVSLDDELAEFKKTMLEDAEKERARIMKETEAMAQRIREQARLMYEQEMKDVQDKVKGEIARLTMEKAERVVSEKINRTDHDRMVQEFIQKLRSMN